MARITRLTAEQEARFPEFVAKWTAFGLSTAPADRDKAECAIGGLYRLAKLREPRVIWLRCPLSASLAAVVYTAIRNIQGRNNAERSGALFRPSATTAVDTAVRTAVHAAVRTAVDTAVRTAVDTAVRTAVDTAVHAAVRTAVDTAVHTAVRTAVHAAVHAAVDTAVHAAVDAAVDTAVHAAVGTAVHAAVDAAVDTAVDTAVHTAVRTAGYAYFGGSLWAAYAAWVDYFNEVLSVSIDRNYLDLVESCGFYWTLDDVCFASERPRAINLDDRGRLHSGDGQSIGYPSGWGLYHWHGVVVSREIIEAPETITIAAIDAEANTEARRVMMERYGWSRYLKDVGAAILNHDDRWGTLYRREIAGDEPLVMVEVINRSPEPDGTFRHYTLRVAPDCRPLFANGGKGNRQKLTALNAVASTFGMRGKDYAAMLSAES